MCKLNKSGIRNNLEDCVLNKKIPLLGICVGMQILSKSSEEGKENGLGWIDGTVKKFNIDSIPFRTKLPHMGWNTISINNKNSLIDQLDLESKFYFLHSYYFQCNDSIDILTSTNYGINFTSAISNENIYGVQFHPEKSHQNGVKLLKNFAKLC
jgi:glutamine amidotransferase